MKFIYDATNYVADKEYKGTIFRFDPTLVLPEGVENAGLSLKEILNMTDDEANMIILEEKWAQIRKIRDNLLKETDWTAGQDIPQNIKDKYFPYREKLRNITDNSNPDDIIFPTL